MAAATLEHAAKFTYDDYRTVPEDRRYELLDGSWMEIWSRRRRRT